MLIRQTLEQKLQLNLFIEDDKLKDVFLPSEIDIVRRYKAAAMLWYEDVYLSEQNIRTFLIENFNISKSQAYRDIPRIISIIGSPVALSKEFQRRRANQMIQDGFNMVKNAKTHLEVKRGDAMIKAGMAMGKVNRLEKDDVQNLPWDEILPQPYEITNDVSELGLEPISNLEKLKMKLRKKYGGDNEIEDAKFEDITHEESVSK